MELPRPCIIGHMIDVSSLEIYHHRIRTVLYLHIHLFVSACNSSRSFMADSSSSSVLIVELAAFITAVLDKYFQLSDSLCLHML